MHIYYSDELMCLCRLLHGFNRVVFKALMLQWKQIEQIAFQHINILIAFKH